MACCAVGQAVPENYGNPRPADGRVALGCAIVDEAQVATSDVDAEGNSVRALPGWSTALSVSHSKWVLYGAFVWARGALSS